MQLKCKTLEFLKKIFKNIKKNLKLLYTVIVQNIGILTKMNIFEN